MGALMTKFKNLKLFKKGGLIRFLIGVGLILAIGYLLITYVPFFSKYDHYVIGSDSMEPVIMVGDVVIIDTTYDLDELHEGDIIAFYADIRQNGTIVVVVHYLYSITEVDGIRTFKTKPEISDSTDPWELVDADIVGLHVLTVPKVGPILLFAQSTIGRIVIIGDIVLIYLVLEMFKPKKKKATSMAEVDSSKDQIVPKHEQ
jgi:signal peptidase I